MSQVMTEKTQAAEARSQETRSFMRQVRAVTRRKYTPEKKIRNHQTVKREVNQVPYEVPQDLESAIKEFVDFYNHHRYHKALGDVTPADMLQGRREQILEHRKEVQHETFERRRRYNQAVRNALNKGASPPS